MEPGERAYRPEDTAERTKRFAIRVVKMTAALPRDRVMEVLGRQLLKAGTSIGANYHEAQGASTKRHFVTMVEIAQREARETMYWLDVIAGSGLIPETRLSALREEANQLLSILTSIVRTAKASP